MDKPDGDISSTGNAEALYDPLLDIPAIDGAAVSMFVGSTGAATIAASDERASKLDHHQIQVGEGPSWDATTTGQPVLVPDFHDSKHDEWPKLGEAVGADAELTDVSAVFGFPLIAGSVSLGAVDLYSKQSEPLTEGHLEQVSDAVEEVTSEVVRRVLTRPADEATDDQDKAAWSQHQISQATQVLVEDLQIDEDDSTLLLHANAYTTGRSVTKVAGDVILGRVDFTANTVDGEPESHPSGTPTTE